MSTDLYRRLTAMLKAAGCHFVRHGKGSHEIWFSPATNRAFTLPQNIKLKTTARGVLKDVGVDERL